MPANRIRTAMSDVSLEVLRIAKSGTGKELKQLLQSLPQSEAKDVLKTAKDQNGRFPIHVACYYANHEVVDLLFAVQPNSHALRDADALRGATSIHYAAWGGDRAIVEASLAQGASLNDLDCVGNTPLLYAVFGGHLVLVKHFVEQGRQLTEENHKGHTAVIQAACGGHLHVLRYLLSISPRAVQRRDRAGNSALLFAAWGGHLPLVQWLLAHGADIHETSDSGHTALLSAANSGATEVVMWLIESGHADINERNVNKDTCLLLAAYGGHLDLFRWLLAHGASLEERNEDDLDALLSACNGGQLDMVRHLVSLGASLFSKNGNGYTPLILASCGGHVELMQWLVEQGCCVSDRTEEGDTPLLLSSYCGHLGAVKWLVEEKGASLSESNHAGLTPLISAANGGHVAVVRYLLQQGASVHEQDNDGYTAYLLAARRGHLDCVKVLAMYGANQSARIRQQLDAIALAHEHPHTRQWIIGTQDYTPLHIAVVLQQNDFIKQLLHKGMSPFCQTTRNEPITPYLLATSEQACLRANAASKASYMQLQHRTTGIDFESEGDEAYSDIVPTPIAKTCMLLHSATVPWRPSTHNYFGPATRQTIQLILETARLVNNFSSLPALPEEIWFHIAALVGRCPEDHVAAMRAITLHPRDAAVAEAAEARMHGHGIEAEVVNAAFDTDEWEREHNSGIIEGSRTAEEAAADQARGVGEDDFTLFAEFADLDDDEDDVDDDNVDDDDDDDGSEMYFVPGDLTSDHFYALASGNEEEEEEEEDNANDDGDTDLNHHSMGCDEGSDEPVANSNLSASPTSSLTRSVIASAFSSLVGRRWARAHPQSMLEASDKGSQEGEHGRVHADCHMAAGRTHTRTSVECNNGASMRRRRRRSRDRVAGSSEQQLPITSSSAPTSPSGTTPLQFGWAWGVHTSNATDCLTTTATATVCDSSSVTPSRPFPAAIDECERARHPRQQPATLAPAYAESCEYPDSLEDSGYV